MGDHRDPRLQRRSPSQPNPYFRRAPDSSTIYTDRDPSLSSSAGRSQNAVNYPDRCRGGASDTMRGIPMQQNRAALDRERELQRKIEDLEELLALKTRQIQAEEGRAERWKHESLEEEKRLKRTSIELAEKETLLLEKEKDFHDTLKNMESKIKKLKDENDRLNRDKCEAEKKLKELMEKHEKTKQDGRSITEFQNKYELLKKNHTTQIGKMKAELESVKTQYQKLSSEKKEMDTALGKAIDLLQHAQKRKGSVMAMDSETSQHQPKPQEKKKKAEPLSSVETKM